jgi:hypothetical protein
MLGRVSKSGSDVRAGPSSEADLARGVVPVCRGGQCCDRLVCAFFRLVG